MITYFIIGEIVVLLGMFAGCRFGNHSFATSALTCAIIVCAWPAILTHAVFSRRDE